MRRYFIPLVLLLGRGPAFAADRPSILFIFNDDQRADTIAALGNHVIRTPNLDRLCRQGMAFSRAYMQGGFNGATCVPSRAMLLSGQSLWDADELLLRHPRTPEAVEAMNADYYRYISYLDQQIGRILDALAASPYASNTFVVFSADSGVARGSHGLIGKQNLYEHSVRVPLIIAGPGIPAGTETAAMCYLYDVLPTLGKLCGVTNKEPSDAREFSATLHDPSHPSRSELVFAYRDFQRAIRDDRWKLIRYPQINKTQLFDLRNDPFELHGLAGNPESAGRVGESLLHLERALKQYGDKCALAVPNPKPAAWSPPTERAQKKQTPLPTLGQGLPKEDLAFLRDMTRDVVEASRVKPNSNGGGRWPITNSCGFTLVTPGKDTYTAFWVRDFSMAVDSGFITAEELRNHLLLTCKAQNGPAELTLANGLHVPAWAIADHINYDGRPSFYPGTYSSGHDQGSGACGRVPPIDDHYEFALHLGVLDRAHATAARKTVADAVRRRTITLEGGVRQVPTDQDFSKTTAWERSMCAINTYQNGGYWHTASGWLIEALWEWDRPLALQVFGEMLAHLRAQDFRQGPGYGAPWEVFGPNGQARQNGVYMASVALPYGILKGLQRHPGRDGRLGSKGPFPAPNASRPARVGPA
jgi:hypothetical protein